MTHWPGKPVPGRFLGEPELLPSVTCRYCGKRGHVYLRVWLAHDEAWEDERYVCAACRHYWWVDGIDA